MNPRTRTMLLSGGLATATVIVGALAGNSIYSSASAKSTVRTAAVQQGTVQSTVTATGNVAPASALSVNFQNGGTVTQIDIKVGDQVKAGETLAKIDDSQTQAALNTAQASLTAAQASLANVEQPLTPAAAAQNAAALATAQQQVQAAQTGVGSAQQSAALSSVGYQNAVNQAEAQLNRDVNQFNSDQGTCATPTTSGTGSSGGQSCTSVLNADQNAIVKDNDAIVNAQQQQATGQLKDQQSIQQAQNSLISAQNGLASTQAANAGKAASTPASVASAQSQVAQAQANLQTAQKNEAGTTLTAPSDGTIASLTGIVGQTVSGSGTTAASTGSSSSSGATGTGASSSSTSSSAFVTLDDTSALMVVSGFAEVDASKVQVGQPATVTLNALPNQAVTGQVTRVDVNATVVSNVVTYNVTVVLTSPPATVKPGMTASVSVVVNQHDNVLYLPTADVTTRGATSTVTLLRNGKQIPQVVTIGLVGDQDTEITSGLNQGDVVVAPTVSVSATGTGTGTRTGTGTGGLGGGGGGGLLGGGGGGGGGGVRVGGG